MIIVIIAFTLITGLFIYKSFNKSKKENNNGGVSGGESQQQDTTEDSIMSN